MSTTLTIDLDPRVLQNAEQEARRRHTTVTAIVGRQLQIMALNWQASQAGRTPVTDALRGAVPLPPDLDERAALTSELSRKHGGVGRFSSPRSDERIGVIITRNKSDFPEFVLPILAPDEYLAELEKLKPESGNLKALGAPQSFCGSACSCAATDFRNGHGYDPGTEDRKERKEGPNPTKAMV